MISQRSLTLYVRFVEHFHRQICGSIYQSGHPMANEDGFRTDIIEAMRHIKAPILCWPDGCFVSSCPWKAAGNKEAENINNLRIPLTKPAEVALLTSNDDSKEACDNVEHMGVTVTEMNLGMCEGEVQA